MVPSIHPVLRTDQSHSIIVAYYFLLSKQDPEIPEILHLGFGVISSAFLILRDPSIISNKMLVFTAIRMEPEQSFPWMSWFGSSGWRSSLSSRLYKSPTELFVVCRAVDVDLYSLPVWQTLTSLSILAPCDTIEYVCDCYAATKFSAATETQISDLTTTLKPSQQKSEAGW